MPLTRPTALRLRSQLAGKLSSAVACQALLSAANLLVGLILIRHSTNEQYGLYILATNAITLMVTLQTSFFSPSLNHRLSRTDPAQQAALVGGFLREQGRLMKWLGGLLALGVPVAWLMDGLSLLQVSLVLSTAVSGLLLLRREFFRTLLFAHHQPQSVLRTDVLYAGLLVGGALLASLSQQAALAALAALGGAALVSAGLFWRTLSRQHPWDAQGLPGLLRDMAPLAAWSTAGAAIHWTFSQGYIYLVAGTLEVAAVAAIAATRLLMMPINLMSVGIGSVMMPLSARWLHQLGSRTLLQRLALCALGMGLLTATYFGVVWLLRDWIFTVILKKQFAERDVLLLSWGGIMMLSVMRDQLGLFLISRNRFQSLAFNTLGSALLSLSCSYAAMRQWGAEGALFGLLVGELVNLGGILWMIGRDSALRPDADAPGQ